MLLQQSSFSRSVRFALAAAFVFVNCSLHAWAGGSFFRNGAVGGVAIDVNGVLAEPSKQAAEHLVKVMQERVQPAQAGMNEATDLRRISLKKLSAAVAEASKNQKELPAEYRYLAGMQRVKYVFVYPEQNDIVLAGPGEGWKVNDEGVVVGETTGMPVLHLDDLLIALRTSDKAREVGVSCSIDPTQAGIRRMAAVVRKQGQFHPSVLAKMEKALGPQQISLTGIPADSHFARVMVAADYRMKRIAMKLERSPLSQLPSYLDMLKSSRVKVKNIMPRWWLACDYEPMARTADGLGWELRGPGVKVMTESEVVDANGTRKATGKRADLAKKWADTMSANYDDLATKSPIFGQLRNLMDMAVIAAVMDKHQLAQQAGCDLSALSGDDVTVASWNVPRSVSTQCSVTKRGREFLVTASGGVQIESWQVADKAQVDPRVAKVYRKAAVENKAWWQ